MLFNNGFVNSTITCTKNKEIDLDALNLLAFGTNPNLCLCAYKEERGHHNFLYTTNGLTSLDQSHANCSFEDALVFISAIISLIEVIKVNHLTLDNFKISKEYIFKSNEGYQFVYIPIISNAYISLKDFSLRFISAIKVKDDRINKLVKELKKIKKDEQVTEYLKSFLESFSSVNQCDKYDSTLLKQNSMGEESNHEQEAETSLLTTEGETTMLSESNYYCEQQNLQNTCVSSGKLTEVYHDESSEYETTVLTSQPLYTQSDSIANLDCKYLLFLIRNLTGEKVPIEITPFTIGKDRSSMDYVLDNNSVSRHHATILYEDGRYYIMDNCSTNGTVIEGIQLQSYEKAELENGYIVSIGNESFQALLERR